MNRSLLKIYFLLIFVLSGYYDIYSKNMFVTSKKGVAATSFSGSTLENTDAAWYYNWWLYPNNRNDPQNSGDIEYVPMIGNAGTVTDDNINMLKQACDNGTYSHLLGFNEPDISEQASMSVSQAIELWPRLEETGLRLGSPAPSWTNSWFSDFMEQAEANNLRVDFICLHFYRSPASERCVDELESFLTNAYEQYQKPIWLTEFGAPDCNLLGWCGQADPLTQEITDEYTDNVITMLEDHPYVERYAWFIDYSDHDGFRFSTLFDSNGNLTQTGTVFRDAAGSAEVKSSLLSGSGSHYPFVTQSGTNLLFRIPHPFTDYSISIFDMSGRCFLNLEGSGRKTVRINPEKEGLSRGIYIASMKSGRILKRRSFILCNK